MPFFFLSFFPSFPPLLIPENFLELHSMLCCSRTNSYHYSFTQKCSASKIVIGFMACVQGGGWQATSSLCMCVMVNVCRYVCSIFVVVCMLLCLCVNQRMSARVQTDIISVHIYNDTRTLAEDYLWWTDSKTARTNAHFLHYITYYPDTAPVLVSLQCSYYIYFISPNQLSRIT